MSRQTNGINHLNLLEIGTDELQWWQAEIQARLEALQMSRMASPGWFGQRKAGPSGAVRYGWRVDEDGTTGKLRLQSIVGSGINALGTKTGNQIAPQRLGGILPTGKLIELEYADDVPLRDAALAQITVPNDATWRTLVAVAATTVKEPGQLQLVQNSATVTGSRTAFTRYSSVAADPIPTVLRVEAADSANGNEGTYTIQTITDDGTITVSPPPPGADENVRFSVQGRFFTPPAPGAPVASHRNAILAWELRARVTTPPADALVAYDVFRDTAGTGPNVILIERRTANEYRPMPAPGDPVATALIAEGGSADMTTSPRTRGVTIDTFGTHGAAAVLALDMAPAASPTINNLLFKLAGGFAGVTVAHVETDGIHSFNTNPTLAAAFTGLSETLTIAQAGITGMSLEAIPGGKGGWTHMVAYSTGGKIRVARSADNGTTFTGAGVVWDPTVVAALDTCNYPALLYTKWGRIILAAVYFDQSAGTRKICTIYSDNYGDSWVTNGNNGEIAVGSTVNPRHIDLAQDGYGNIHGVYVEEGADDEIWSWIGTNPNNAAIDPDRATTANRGLLFYSNQGGTSVGQPRCLAFDDGTVAVVWSENEGAADDQYLLLAHLKEGELYRIEEFMFLDEADYAGPTQTPCAMVQLNSGGVIIAGVDCDAVSDGRITGVRLIPASVSGGSGWPGGR